MPLKQLSIFLENRPGSLRPPICALAEEGIDILTLSLADTTEFGILRLIVQDWDKGRRVLEQAGWVVTVSEVVAVGVADRPGGLAEVLAVLEGAGLDIEYLYAFALRDEDKAFLIFRFDDPARATSVLRGHGLHVLDITDLLRGSA
ncbi:amino acid-binding protein [Thiohalocapsa marina]|uniref:Amino acid-binding protein n=1 Tax=Thiohalocapsa marina TaxID=424902 RepID=A0A5M8FJQ8_9GAMM|nr:amino acid-binding protein [Thiohalocapsa marina]KAA6185143.1 amino acid-binding protein [Thiohalocapsa marina]